MKMKFDEGLVVEIDLFMYRRHETHYCFCIVWLLASSSKLVFVFTNVTVSGLYFESVIVGNINLVGKKDIYSIPFVAYAHCKTVMCTTC